MKTPKKAIFSALAVILLFASIVVMAPLQVQATPAFNGPSHYVVGAGASFTVNVTCPTNRNSDLVVRLVAYPYTELGRLSAVSAAGHHAIPCTAPTATGAYDIEIDYGGYRASGTLEVVTPSAPAPSNGTEEFWYDILYEVQNPPSATITTNASNHLYVCYFILQHVYEAPELTLVIRVGEKNIRLSRASMDRRGVNPNMSYSFADLMALGF